MSAARPITNPIANSVANTVPSFPAVSATAMPVDLTILVVSYNTRALLLDCLAALDAAVVADATVIAQGSVVAEGSARYTHEVIVVDNGSTDGSVEAVRAAWPTVRVIANTRNQGFVRANNQGIASARGRYILLLNSDTVATPGSLARLVQFADEQPAVGIAGARLVYPDGAPQNSWADFPTLWSELTGRNLQRNGRPLAAPGWNAMQVDWVNGAAFLCRRTLLESVGVLDEAIFMYSEETDLCYRARAAGWQVACLADATVMHWGGASADSHSARKLQLLYGGKLYFFRKHYGRVRTLALRVCLLAATLWGIVRRSARMVVGREARAATLPAVQARWTLLGFLLRPIQGSAAFVDLPADPPAVPPREQSHVQRR